MPTKMNSMTLPLAPFWAIEGTRFQQIIQAIEARQHFAFDIAELTEDDQDVEDVTEMCGPVAVIHCEGVICKSAGWLTSLFGGVSSIALRKAVDAAASNDAVKCIMLRIDSPGGEVDGMAELVDAIAKARDAKHVVAQICGLGASAAYWVASQADRCFAHRMDQVGSIGVRLVMYDMSRAFVSAGIEAVTFDTGEYKSLGVPGTMITKAQREYCQQTVDKYCAEFVGSVASGRKMGIDAAKALADGRCWMADDALANGLIDGIQTEEDTLEEMQSMAGTPKRSAAMSASRVASHKEANQMAESVTPATAPEPVQPKAATVAELKAKYPKASAEWVLSCVEAGATMASAADLWAVELEKRLAATVEKPGIDPVGGNGTPAAETETEPDALVAWPAAVASKIKAGLTRRQAIAAVDKEQPGLRDEYIESYNEANPRK